MYMPLILNRHADQYERLLYIIDILFYTFIIINALTHESNYVTIYLPS